VILFGRGPRGCGCSTLLFVLVALAIVTCSTTGGGGGGGGAGAGGGFGGVESPFDPYDPRFPQGQGPRTVPGAPTAGEGELLEFIEFLDADLSNFWLEQIQSNGGDYDDSEVNAFRGAVRTGCGPADASVGPFYCPADGQIYLDLSFFRELEQRFDAPGDFAQAYVIAHEFGHHVQALTGVTRQVDAAVRADPSQANALSIRQELMADCLAGVWAHSTYERGLLESGDLEEGLAAAAAVGDDRIQAEATGRIRPETWTHGSSEQRRRWFLRGFEGGAPSACDTFGASAV
jgi:hypothetical protein